MERIYQTKRTYETKIKSMSRERVYETKGKTQRNPAILSPNFERRDYTEAVQNATCRRTNLKRGEYNNIPLFRDVLDSFQSRPSGSPGFAMIHTSDTLKDDILDMIMSSYHDANEFHNSSISIVHIYFPFLITPPVAYALLLATIAQSTIFRVMRREQDKWFEDLTNIFKKGRKGLQKCLCVLDGVDDLVRSIEMFL